MPDRYTMHRLWLNFVTTEVETRYVEQTLRATRQFSRLTWVLLLLMLPALAVTDSMVFGDAAGAALNYRIALFSFAVVMLALGWLPKLAPWGWLTPSLFAISTGLFSVALITLGDPTSFSPYVIGFFFAFAGVFSTSGVGVRSGIGALFANIVLFEVAIVWIHPVSAEMFVIYNFFVPGIILVYVYLVYMMGRAARRNWVRAELLVQSAAEIKTLSGLLPICASCKRVRSDDGYWEQIETYISHRSDAQFSHGICEDCVTKLYPEFKD